MSCRLLWSLHHGDVAAVLHDHGCTIFDPFLQSLYRRHMKASVLVTPKHERPGLDFPQVRFQRLQLGMDSFEDSLILTPTIPGSTDGS
jgi:hypothetical protein